MVCGKYVRRVLIAALLAALLEGVPLLAHHSFAAAEYDDKQAAHAHRNGG